MPSSSRWSKTSGASSAHCPEATHLGTSTSTFMFMGGLRLVRRVVTGSGRVAAVRSPGHRQFADSVDARGFFEGEVLQGRVETQSGQPSEQLGQDDLEFGAGQRLAEALVDALPERDVLTCVGPAEVQAVGVGEGEPAIQQSAPSRTAARSRGREVMAIWIMTSPAREAVAVASHPISGGDSARHTRRVRRLPPPCSTFSVPFDGTAPGPVDSAGGRSFRQ